MSLTQDLLLEMFDYNPETGILTNKKRNKPAGWVKHEKATDYLSTGINGKHYRVHRIIWIMMTGEIPNTVDHIDGNGLNNKWDNLRNVSITENNRNKRVQKNNKSGVSGVRWNTKANRWIARISTNEGRIHLGSFILLEDAIAARKAAEITYGYHENHGRII